MNTKIKILLFIFSLFLLSSCQKDTDIFTPNGTTTGADTNWVSSISSLNNVSQLKESLKRSIFLDSVDAAIGGTILTSEGLSVTVLPQTCLLPTGQLAAGKIFIETMLIKKKGDMILMDKPTSSSNAVLISGGEVFIRLRKENDELHLIPNAKVLIKYSDVLSSSQMRLFYGDESNPDRFNWIPGSDSLRINTQTSGYEISSTHLRWINCDYFADSTGARVNVTASLPVDCTNANTEVYLVFKDQKSVMGMYGDASTKKFSSPKVPTGKQVIVISITKKANNSYYLAHETITTGATGTVNGQVVPLSPQPTSLNDIKAYLATL